MEPLELLPKEENIICPYRIREELRKEIRVEELPAVDILAEQINNDYANLKDNLSTEYDKEKLATTLAERFLEVHKNPDYNPHIPLYSKVINIPEVIPPAFDSEVTSQTEGKKVLASIDNALHYIKEIKGDDIHIATDYYGWAHIHGGQNISNILLICPPSDAKNKYRIYLSPEPMTIGEMLHEIIKTIPEKIYYSIKTFSAESDIKTLTRGDKIICYCTEENFDDMVETISTVCRKNPTLLNGRPSPGGGQYSPISGLSCAKESDLSTLTPSENNAILIQATLERNSQRVAGIELGNDYTKAILSEFIYRNISLAEKPGNALKQILSIDKHFF